MLKRSSIVCNNDNFYFFKSMKKRKKLKRPKVNIILSQVNHTFLILDLRIGPQAFRHTHCTIRIFFFLKHEEGSNSRLNLVQIGP